MAGARHLLAWSLLFLYTLGAYRSALHGWWRHDDTYNLYFALRNGPWRQFVDPETWRSFATANLTPWIHFAYWLDAALFGLTPAGFYAHHLLSVWAIGGMTYAVLRLWVGWWPALLGAAVFLAGVPVADTVQQLMTRHYLDGLLFALLATWFVVSGARGGRPSFYWIGAGFYLLAVTAKEIYVPLPLLLLGVGLTGDWRARSRALVPYWLVLAAYVPWRWWMIGNLFSGYQAQVTAGPDGARDVMLVAARAAQRALLGPPGWGRWVIVAGLVASVLVFLLRFRAAWLAIVWTAALVALPLGKVGAGLTDRMLVVPWLLVSVAVALAMRADPVAGRRVTAPRLAVIASVVILLASTVQGHAAHAERREGYARLAVEGRFLWAAGGTDVLYDPAHPVWHHSGVIFLRRMSDRGESPGVARPGEPLALVGEGRTFWRYDAVSREMRAMDAGALEEERARWRPTIDWSRSLAVSIVYDDHAKLVSWHLGPYTGGGFFFLTNGYLTRVASAGRLRFPLDRDQPLHVRYDSPEGWRTYSDLLVIPVRHDDRTRVEWRR